ncbi:RNA-3'-phosphate cyclase [Piptocephalis cylindrospora]|uniref:RNA-3'-phosphate cyclase n=1 Tax=Piptocephalis cylindrospora TaxID=1907219 RepID=A0A4P9Y104_9FUNG|nr:RNA-3'-phosphate cyclase [Piptocephalis cylindrospora]|eukprot:RKP12427.1 RNA-3'-phosphate cyclase [Piptocephalis cylindrospora]
MVGKETLTFEGHQFFRQRLVMATLAGRTIRIIRIRSDDLSPGLRDFEANLLRLLERVTNGSIVEIGETGTSILYRPGVIVGGKFRHDCGNRALLSEDSGPDGERKTNRAIGYCLEMLLALAPFGQRLMDATLTGITSDNFDLSVDTIRTVTLPQLKRYGVPDGVELKITRRGAPPLGGGEVTFRCPTVRTLKPLLFVDEGRIRRIRGIAYATRVSPQTANRMVESARSVLNRYIPDVYIYTDHYKGAESGKSPGFALSLVAESTTGVLLSAERAGEAGETPEDIGVRVARLLLETVARGGCVDSAHQWLPLLWMTFSPEDVGRVKMGPLEPRSIQYLRDLRAMAGTRGSKVRREGGKRTLVTCVGTGYVNAGKKTT